MTGFAELVSAGLLIGMFIGVSGVGGGSVMTPVLILLLGINPITAVGTDLLYSVPTKILGALTHSRQRTIDWRIVRALLTGAIPAALVGLFVLYVLRHTVDVNALSGMVKRCVAIALIVSAASLVYSAFRYRKELTWKEDPQNDRPPRKVPLAITGAVVGFFVALTSVGSGSITMPLLLLIAPYAGLRRLVGCDIAFAAFLIPIAAAGHIALGDVNYGVAFSLLVGSLPGVYIGSRLCKGLSEIWLRPAVAMVLVIAGTRMM